MAIRRTRVSVRQQAVVPWDEIKTVMVDMDGTLLDLAFDNFFWQELVPSRYAVLRNLPEEDARVEVLRQYNDVEGQLEWYCIDHWSETLGLDIRSLKWEHRERVRYLPRATEFLSAVRSFGKRLLLVTNAHRAALEVKVAQTSLDREVDALISSHDYAAPKQSQAFWHRLRSEEDFDPESTLLIEDSISVLEAASDFGVKFTVAIRCPDSGEPAREITSFPAVNSVHELCDHLST
jgi:putative hydrolase of the HAD superfamily